MDNRPIAIKVSGVKKMYKLGQIGGGTLRADLQSWWAKKRGKEDPNTKIGEDQRSNGETFMALNGHSQKLLRTKISKIYADSLLPYRNIFGIFGYFCKADGRHIMSDDMLI